jgi:plasmid stabilization system protein ParE
MKLKISTSFRDRLTRQIEYIANDKPSAARKFKAEIIARIKEIPQMPYSHRKSIFFDREDIRELIYKGYIIVYKVNKKENTIVVFGFAKFQDSPL